MTLCKLVSKNCMKCSWMERPFWRVLLPACRHWKGRGGFTFSWRGQWCLCQFSFLDLTPFWASFLIALLKTPFPLSHALKYPASYSGCCVMTIKFLNILFNNICLRKTNYLQKKNCFNFVFYIKLPVMVLTNTILVSIFFYIMLISLIYNYSTWNVISSIGRIIPNNKTKLFLVFS